LAFIGPKGKMVTSVFVVLIATLVVLYITDAEPVSLLGVIAGCLSVAYAAAMIIIGRNK
jgi:hypothetical protein